MKTRISLPAGVAIFVALALAGMMGVFAFNAPQAAEAQANNGANADLKSLKLMDGSRELTLTPTFDSDKTFYDAENAGDLDSVTVAAEPDNDGAMVQLPGTDGAVPITSGTNDMAVVVTSADGSASKVYFIRLTSYGANDLKALKIYEGTDATGEEVSLEPDFTYDRRTYTATVESSVTGVFVQATPADSDANIGGTSRAADADTDTALSFTDNSVNAEIKEDGVTGLTVGVNTVTVTVNGAAYTIRITQTAAPTASDNANLKSLEVGFGDHKAALVPAFTPDRQLYSATVPHSAGRTGNAVTVEGEADDADLADTAVVVGGATLDGLTDGVNTVTVTVTAADGSTKVYTVIITRLEAGMNDLTSLTVLESAGGSDPVSLKDSFRSDHQTYTASVETAITEVTVTATAAGTGAAVITATKAGNVVAVTAGAITVSEGTYVIKATVTTPGESTSKVYTVTLTVSDSPAAGEDADLKSLTVTTDDDDSVSFDQGGFAPGTISYTATVPSSVDEVTIVATPSDSDATLTATATNAAAVTITINNNFGNNDAEAVIPDLTEGVNTVTITVTADDGNTTKAYTLAIQKLAASDDAKLKSLMVTTNSGRQGLTPTFDEDIFGYTAMVAPTVSSVTVNAEAAHRYAKAESPGMVSLDPGMTQIIVVVTAEDGSTKQGYLVWVTKDAPSNDASLRSLTVSVGEGEDVSLSPAFQSEGTAYHGSVRYSVETVTVNAVAADGATITSGTGSHDLMAGTSSIRVMVTAEDGTTTMTYTILITKLAPSGDATLSQLDLWLYPMTDPMTEIGDLTTTFMPGTSAYTVMAENSVESVKVRATPTHMGAAAEVAAMMDDTYVTVTDNVVPLAVGDTVITATVTAEDQSTMAYTITVTRASTDTTLSSLSLSAGTLMPEFMADTTDYTAMVDYAVDSVTVTATASHSGAAISGDGMHSLTVGENTINVMVTAEDGMPMMTYTIVITREAASSDATLSALSLSDGTLDPAFMADTMAYTAMVDYAVESVTVTATANDAMASVADDGMHDLDVGANTITVTVTAADGSTMMYTITVTRAAGTPVERFDANKDGAIDAAEVRAAIEDFLSDNPTLDAAGVGAVIDKFLE